MTGRTGIISLDDESAAFREACVRLVERSMVRQLVAQLMIDLGYEPTPTAIEMVSLELRKWLVWSVDHAGRPVFSTIGVGLDDFARTVIRCEAAGLLVPDFT